MRAEMSARQMFTWDLQPVSSLCRLLSGFPFSARQSKQSKPERLSRKATILAPIPRTLPPWEGVPPPTPVGPAELALGATTNYSYLLLLTRTVVQPLSFVFRVALRRPSSLFLSSFHDAVAVLYLTICAPRDASLSAASFPLTPVCDLTCSILTSSPLLRVRFAVCVSQLCLLAQGWRSFVSVRGLSGQSPYLLRICCRPQR